MEKTVICESCGAEFADNLPKCPYCGTLNYKGAEAEYMEKLQDVQENMEELGNVPQEAKGAIVKKNKLVLKIILIVAGVCIALNVIISTVLDYRERKRTEREMYWRLENYPILNDLYDRGEYEKMYEYYRNGEEYGGNMWTWAHRDFCDVYSYLEEAEMLIQEEAAGEEIYQGSYTSLLNAELHLLGLDYAHEELSEDERENLKALAEPVIKDFYDRWNMDEDTLEQVERMLKENDGYLDYSFCSDYVEQWYESEEQK